MSRTPCDRFGETFRFASSGVDLSEMGPAIIAGARDVVTMFTGSGFLNEILDQRRIPFD